MPFAPWVPRLIHLPAPLALARSNLISLPSFAFWNWSCPSAEEARTAIVPFAPSLGFFLSQHVLFKMAEKEGARAFSLCQRAAAARVHI